MDALRAEKDEAVHQQQEQEQHDGQLVADRDADVGGDHQDGCQREARRHHQDDDDKGEQARPLDACADEVLAMILEKVPVRDLLRVVPRVSQQLRRVAMDPMVWRRAALAFPEHAAAKKDPQLVDDFLESLAHAPSLYSLDLQTVPFDLEVSQPPPPPPGAFDPFDWDEPQWHGHVPVTPLVTEGRLRLDRDVKLRELSCSIYLTGLPALLRANAATLRRLVLTDLYEPSTEDLDFDALEALIADATRALAGLRCLTSLELHFTGYTTGRITHTTNDFCQRLFERGDAMLFAAVLALPSLRSLSLDAFLTTADSVLAVLADDGPGGLGLGRRRRQQPSPDSMQLERLCIDPNYSHLPDSALAGLVLASRSTLRSLSAPTPACGADAEAGLDLGLGPRTVRALARCPRLEACALPSLDWLVALADEAARTTTTMSRWADLTLPPPAGLPQLRRLHIQWHKETRCTAADLERCRFLLERLEELSLDGPRSVELLSVLTKHCTRLRRLELYECEIMIHPYTTPARLGPGSNPVVLLALLQGALPALEELWVRRYHGKWLPDWEQPMKQLRVLRPALRIT